MKRLHWISFSSTWLMLLLQRTPVLKLPQWAAEAGGLTRIVALLRNLGATAGALGAVHSVAGATTLSATPTSPAAATVGVSFRVAYAITGAQSAAASWTVGGSIPPGLTFNNGATGGTINVANLVLSGTPTTAGTYTFTLRGWERVNAGAAGSPTYTYVVNVAAAAVAAVAPSFTTQPAAQTADLGGTVTFTAAATGTPAPTYQWHKDGVALAGATSAALTLGSLLASDAGAYSVVATNSAGSATSNAAALTVRAATAGLAFTLQPQSQQVAAGGTVVLTAATGTAGTTWQWRKDGTALAGATGATLTLPAANAATMGFYTVVATAGATSVTSDVAIVTVATGGPSRLINVSTRGFVPAGGSLTPGFVLKGNASKALVIRAVGPTLGSFGVAGTLADPLMEIIPLGSSNAVAANDNWGGATELQVAFNRVGAFPLSAATSNDASVETSLAANGATGYTVRIAGKAGASGIALAEVYDEQALDAPVRLVNVSTSGFVGTGDQALVPGFVIGGTAPKALLIRAVGPGLEVFGVGGVLADPQLAVVPLGKDFNVAANDNWGGTATLQTAFSQAGAFALPAASNDAVVLVRLPPGGYTVLVSGRNATTGNALVEVYDLDP